MKKTILLILFLGLFFNTALAGEFDKAVVSFLKSDYKKTISLCEYIFSLEPDKREDADICYLMAVAYLKDNNLLPAHDMFRLLYDEFYEVRVKEKALLGLIDVSILSRDYQKAADLCEEFLHTFKTSDYLALAYYRLTQCMKHSNNIAMFNIYKQIIFTNYEDSIASYKLSRLE